MHTYICFGILIDLSDNARVGSNVVEIVVVVVVVVQLAMLIASTCGYLPTSVVNCQSGQRRSPPAKAAPAKVAAATATTRLEWHCDHDSQPEAGIGQDRAPARRAQPRKSARVDVT